MEERKLESLERKPRGAHAEEKGELLAARRDGTSRQRRPIKNLRWWIGGMLFASTVINYIDRQTLSALAPFLKKEYNWTNEDYAMIVIAFRVAYAIGQTALGSNG
jgi:sugar phosphate permease